MKYTSTLSSLGYTEATVSKSIKDRMATIKNAEGALAKATTKGDAAKIKEIEADIAEMDNELVAAIEKYHADKDKNAEIARKMKEGREAKKAAKATPAPQPATPLVEKPTEVVPPVEETPRPAETTTEETPPVETKEEGGEVDGKKSSGIGTFLTVALAVGLGFLGFTAWKNNQ